MNQSEQINELAAALSKAQGEIDGAKKDSVNPFYKAAYADLASVMDAAKDPLAKYGLSYSQLTEFNENGIWLETKLMHASGQWLSGRFPLHFPDNKIQTQGSTITYIKRYTLQAMLGIASEDDDGNAAQKSHEGSRPNTASQVKTNTAAVNKKTPDNANAKAASEPDMGKPTPDSKYATATATGTTKTAATSAFRNHPLPEGVEELDKPTLISQIQHIVTINKIPIPKVSELITLNYAPAKMLKDLNAVQLQHLLEYLLTTIGKL